MLIQLLLLAQLFFVVQAEELDQYDQDALNQTVDLLNNREQRQEFINKDQKAKGADDYAHKVGGSQENTDEIYAISSSLMEYLTQKSGGDPQKMQEILKAYETNPEQFLKDMPPEQRARIQSLGRKIGNTTNSPK